MQISILTRFRDVICPCILADAAPTSIFYIHLHLHKAIFIIIITVKLNFRQPFAVFFRKLYSTCKSHGIQRRAARFVKNNYVKEKGTVTNLLKELGWPSLEHRRKYHRLDLFYKTKTGKTALQIPDQLNRPMSRPTRAMDSTWLIRSITKGDNYAQSYFPRTIRDWNNLPRHIRHCTTGSTFKSALFKHFFEWIATCFSF